MYAEMRRPATAPSASSTTSTTSPTARPTTTPTRWRSRSPRRRARPGWRIVLLPAAYHRAGWDGGDLPPDARPAALLRPRRRRPTWRASTPCARGPRRARGVAVGVAAHSVRAVPATWLEAIAAYAERARARPPRPRARAAAGGRRVPRRARHDAHRAARSAPASSGRGPACPRHPRDAEDIALLAGARHRRVLPDDRGQPRGRAAAALAYRDAGVRLAIGTDSQVRVDPFEETRELETLARREGGTRARPARRLRRPVGRAVPERAGEPRPGGAGRGTVASTATIPTSPAWPRRPPARRGDLRVGRGRLPPGAAH